MPTATQNPAYVTLVADTDTTLTLAANYGAVEVVLIANPAVTQFNTTNTAITTSTLTDGNHAVSSTLPAKTVRDESGGGPTVVRLRSSGTPTVGVYGS